MIPDRFFEDAAERSRVSMHVRWNRVRMGWRVMVQAGVAVALAWATAKWLWGHSSPFFAPVSAVIALGTSYHQRGRRAFELIAAVTLGIAAADLLAFQLGPGVVQLGVAVFVAIGLGLFFGTSQLFVNQVAVSAVLVFTVSTAGTHVSFARALDALTGGTIALAVAAVLLPANPLRLLRDAARPVLEELAAVLGDIAGALRTREPDHAEAALVRARGIDELGARFFDATLESRETTRISPARRRARDSVEFYADAAARIDLAVRNVRVLARGAMRALALDENVPPEVAEALDDLAAAVLALGGALERGEAFEGVRGPALRAASVATHVLEGTTNLSVSVIVGQIRSTATDLLTGIGYTYEEATEAVREAAP
ncbi:FUSC family protein [Solirubrobacter ginsenosidimutans]|uniref:FUSC family protein n=1 Tax=Solirubrobacter ginsenosidimutans TaxID=490573 RepID=A0A9X3MXA7_9ACTN|nr:FUSC family protein [Solirubrobacter ginsenosidimutans]MDA0162892.1 FUSC family protein [Solirubrobacter ginsenosidimutans]